MTSNFDELSEDNRNRLTEEALTNKRCPRCGHLGGLISCPVCYAEYRELVALEKELRALEIEEEK